ncbi:MAG: general stress protein CsbD [Chloroflexi bacterium]|jgi:uncharacterized protein YjbJ (UPF0337 family)|nr:general stress protein CsbD [Chloroflexota bacterium]
MVDNLTESEWLKIQADAQQKWDELTDEDLVYIGGDWDKFAEKLREHYHFTKVKAKEEISKFLERFEIDKPLDLG